MGQQFSRNPIQGNEVFEEDQMRSGTTYYGPNFVLDSSGIASGNSRAFFEDIMNVLSTNQDSPDADQLLAFGDLYAQLPPAELKPCKTIQSKINIQKSTLRLSRVKDSPSLRYTLSFKFDLLEPGYIRILWGAKEKLHTSQDGTTYTYVDQDGQKAKEWRLGPFPAGLNQVFELPDSFVINEGILKSADMIWATQIDLETPTSPAMPMSPTFQPLEIHTDVPSSPDTEASSPNPLLPPEATTVQIDPSVRKTAPAEPLHYNLIIVLELGQPSKDSNVDCQSTFVSFAPSHDKLVIQYMKQLVIIDGVSYVLQEIYGFTELETESPNASIRYLYSEPERMCGLYV